LLFHSLTGLVIVGFEFNWKFVPTVAGLKSIPGKLEARNPRASEAVDLDPDTGEVIHEVGETGDGFISIASANVENFFNDLDDGTCPIPAGCRGATTELDFLRQQRKIFSQMEILFPTVAGLEEMENNGDEALRVFTEGLNEHLTKSRSFPNPDNVPPPYPFYEYIATGYIGTDAITNALIYQPNLVQPQGGFQIYEYLNPADRSRPSLAQTFVELATGQNFTVVVNHLKSKGDSGCSTCTAECEADGGCDLGDGQAYWSEARAQVRMIELATCLLCLKQKQKIHCQSPILNDFFFNL
jgi:predicted extracellular nuclease